MGSGSGAKWLLMILLYFGVFLFTTSLVDMASESASDGINESYFGDHDSVCGEPRNIYYPHEEGIVYKTGERGVDEYTDVNLQNDKRVSFSEFLIPKHLECKYSAGVLSNESCQQISGCEWEIDTTLWNTFLNFINLGEDPTETCTGHIDIEGVSTPYDYLGGMRVISKHYNPAGDSICHHPEVYQNESMCNLLSCTWKDEQPIDDIDVEGLEPSTSLVGNVWTTIGDMISFKYDFGIENSAGNTIINFFMFHIPLIGAILSIYVMVRS